MKQLIQSGRCLSFVYFIILHYLKLEIALPIITSMKNDNVQFRQDNLQKLKNSINIEISTALQKQKVVSAYFTSKQIKQQIAVGWEKKFFKGLTNYVFYLSIFIFAIKILLCNQIFFS